MAENKLNFEFVMLRIGGKYLYVHEHDKFYTWAAEKKVGSVAKHTGVSNTAKDANRVCLSQLKQTNVCSPINGNLIHTTKIMNKN